MTQKTRRKIPKWAKVLSRAERVHLKEIHARTKKDFVELNVWHNAQRKKVGSLEPCFACKGIARKLGLPVHSLGDYKIVTDVKKVVVRQAVKIKEPDNFLKMRRAKTMRIVDIKCPILRRLFLCSFIAPCVAYVMAVSSWAALKSSWSAGCETFTELWEGSNGKTSKGFD